MECQRAKLKRSPTHRVVYRYVLYRFIPVGSYRSVLVVKRELALHERLTQCQSSTVTLRYCSPRVARGLATRLGSLPALYIVAT